MSTETLEVEIKVKIDSITGMERRLLDSGATFECELVHSDYYFDLPRQLGSFAITDEALRVRVSEDKTRGVKKQFITYKGKKIDKTTKTREELELGVEDANIARSLLERLRFREVIVVEKYRKIFRKGDISITLDRVEHLPDPYMEVEIVAPASEADVARQRLFSFLERLGIDKERSETRSYLELILVALGLA